MKEKQIRDSGLFKQFNIHHDFNTELQTIDVLIVAETHDGKFYQAVKKIKPFPGLNGKNQ